MSQVIQKLSMQHIYLSVLVAICSGCPDWTILVNHAGSQGQRKVGVYGVQPCMDACLGDLDCVGFDIDIRDNPDSCWIHRRLVNIQFSNIRKMEGVILNILNQRCSGIRDQTCCIGMVCMVGMVGHWYTACQHGTCTLHTGIDTHTYSPTPACSTTSNTISHLSQIYYLEACYSKHNHSLKVITLDIGYLFCILNYRRLKTSCI